MALIDLEIQQMLEKEAIQVVPPGVTSRVCEFNFSSPQKRGWPEACCESPPPRSVHPLQTFQNGRDLYNISRDPLRKGDFMVKIDLKDAQKFPRFVWKETMYEFACLPSGLQAPPEYLRNL